MRENRCIGFINLSRQIFVVQFVVCFGVFFVVIIMLSRRGIVLVSFALQFIRASRRPWDICDCESTLAQGPIRYPNFPISYRKGRKKNKIPCDMYKSCPRYMNSTFNGRSTGSCICLRLDLYMPHVSLLCFYAYRLYLTL